MKKETAYERYVRVNLVSYSLKISRNKDAEIIEHMEKQDNKSGYIRKLIIADMQKEKE